MSNYTNYSSMKSEKNEEEQQQNQKKELQHSFQIRFFNKPILCIHCNDYIWGEGFIGLGCLNCSKCVHTKCALFVKSANCPQNDKTSLDKITRQNLSPVENWNINTVKEWLAVVNLHRYSEVFASYNVNGSKLLNLDIYQLYAFRIRDTFHHTAILQARDELIFRSSKNLSLQQMINEQELAKTHLISNQYKPINHHFLLHTVSKLTDCDLCKRPVLGIIHQGLMCQKCGILSHRQCSHLGLPACKSSNVANLNKHVIFGVSLLEMCSDNNDLYDNLDRVPLLLVKAFKNIEERALINNEDLYDVYRLSSDTIKIDHIKQMINENGLELTQFDRFDLNTIAALVKTFLRDLQDSVIPESLYEKIVNNIQTITSDELRNLIENNLPPTNFDCLKYVMSHLIRVWSYQHKYRGCHYLPDKLFHIFRSILLRPTWDKITQIVYNIENQTLVIQKLMLEYDWGVELPDYKVRPKRPNPYSSSDYDISPSPRHLTGRNSSKDSIKKDSVNENHWYWGSINRDDTLLILKNCPDGSFLVRDSSDKSSINDSPYTLCVMKSSVVKSIKIFKQEQLSIGTCFYDIEKPCRFETLYALISYYSRISLKEYNHNLDVVLTYGVSKYKFGKTTEWSIDKLYSSFRDAFDEYEKSTKKYDGLESEINNLREDLNHKKQASEAFDKIIQMYTSQIEQVDKVINDNLLKKTNAISTTRLLVSQLMPNSFTRPAENAINDDEITRLDELMKNNREKLKTRIDELKLKKESVTSDIIYIGTVMGQLQEELDLLRPELIEIRKKRENYHMWLVQRGENDYKIEKNLQKLSTSDLNDSLASKTSISSTSNDEDTNKNLNYESKDVLKSQSNTDHLHSNSLNWFIPDCTREKAIEILTSKPNGTYLVRSNTKLNSKYILSLVNKNEIKHILIDENLSGCYIKSSYSQKLSHLSTEDGSNLASQLNISTSSLNSTSSNGSYFLSNEDQISASNQDLLKFKTLTELIVFYSKNYIKVNNTSLDTLLLYPAFEKITV